MSIGGKIVAFAAPNGYTLLLAQQAGQRTWEVDAIDPTPTNRSRRTSPAPIQR